MLNRLYGWYGKRVVRGIAAVLIVLICIGFYVHKQNADRADDEAVTRLPEVTVRPVRNLTGTAEFSVVGTVRSVSEAQLKTEAGGRVTSVSVALGDTVAAGTVLATIENSREQAALLQAEGAYESAKAATLQNTVTLDEAKVSVRNTYRTTFTTVDNIVRGLIDEFYSNAATGIIGFRLGGTGRAAEFNEARRSLEPFLTDWSADIAGGYSGLTETEMLRKAESTVILVHSLATEIYREVSDEDGGHNFSEADSTDYQTRLTGARASLDGALASISGARRAYDQAVIIGAQSGSSQSDALLKSALGTLRAAQATYERTFVRTPIAGTVNTLSLTMGDYVQLGVPAAIVANNGSLEITTALGEKDVAAIRIGDTVRIGADESGTVTRVAPGIDPDTGKSEVKISASDTLNLKNGSTVSVTFARTTDITDEGPLFVPIAALKFLVSGAVAFSVSDESTLVSHPVTVGRISGDAVEIVNGLTRDDVIITDARGRMESETVKVVTQ